MPETTELKPSDKPRYTPPVIIRLDQVATGQGGVTTACTNGSGNAVTCSAGYAAGTTCTTGTSVL